MDIWEVNKLVLFIAFVVPGFISLKTYELISAGVSKDSSQQLIDAVAYSSINYALLLWPIYIVEKNGIFVTYPNLHAIFYLFVLLIAPVLWALLFKKLRTTQLFQGALPHPTGKPWDYVFSQRKSFWIIVSLKDGNRIGGRYDSRSFASSAPAADQLYLEETWVVNSDGGFERPRVDSAGILILTPDIVSVEFFNILTEGEENG
jgi:Family of unknown function (DUF6338)